MKPCALNDSGFIIVLAAVCSMEGGDKSTQICSGNTEGERGFGEDALLRRPN